MINFYFINFLNKAQEVYDVSTVLMHYTNYAFEIDVHIFLNFI